MQPPDGHEPVLVQSVLECLQPQGRGLLVDCTVGLGGHAEALLAAAGPQATLIGLDVDENNLRRVRTRLQSHGERVRLFAANFACLGEVLDEAGQGPADLILADLGICSAQLDDPARGLSFSREGPLDMRLDASLETTAADLVRTLGEQPLADLIYEYGQERYSRRIARAIVEARRQKPIETTTQLEEIVFHAVPANARHARTGVHPATRTFQALRIAVNDEMGVLDALLAQLPARLAPGGRAGIISFHSLEDGRVKRAFASWAQTGQASLLTKKPIVADDTEVDRNPRSRSARFRAIQRLG